VNSIQVAVVEKITTIHHAEVVKEGILIAVEITMKKRDEEVIDIVVEQAVKMKMVKVDATLESSESGVQNILLAPVEIRQSVVAMEEVPMYVARNRQLPETIVHTIVGLLQSLYVYA
jgi:hypothetical protein